MIIPSCLTLPPGRNNFERVNVDDIYFVPLACISVIQAVFNMLFLSHY